MVKSKVLLLALLLVASSGYVAAEPIPENIPAVKLDFICPDTDVCKAACDLLKILWNVNQALEILFGCAPTSS